MKMALPQVKTVELPDDPSQFSKILQNLNEFSSFVVTKEDSDRGKMYSEQRKRDELKASVISYDEFLKNLGLVISIKKADDFTIPRISQLTLKTNQFNLTTKRYQEEDIRKFSRGEDFLVSCTQVEDKFGDNGITGVFIVKKDNSKEWIIDTFLLSCRIIGREIEKTMMEQIFQQAKCNGVKRIRAKFIPTQKNKPAEKFLENCGFKKEGDFWIYDLEIPFKKPDFIEVKIE
jgi:FkbH-like protein